MGLFSEGFLRLGFFFFGGGGAFSELVTVLHILLLLIKTPRTNPAIYLLVSLTAVQVSVASSVLTLSPPPTPGWEASLWQGYSQRSSQDKISFIHLGEKRH